MKANEIRQGETYLFVATDSAARKHLEGELFTVVRIENVWRKVYKSSRKVKRFFNDAGDGARADELEPIDGKSLTDSGYLIDTDKTVREVPGDPPDDDLPF
jgi:uncharacterized protein YifE (UPF0438 family)